MLKSSAAAALLAGITLASPGQAASIYYLTQSNALADGVNYVQVTIAEGADSTGSIDFTVEALQPLLDLAGMNFRFTRFAFNVLGGVGAEAEDVDLPKHWRARNGIRMDGFGLFDIGLFGSGTKGQGPLHFSITGVDKDAIESYVDYSTGRAPEGFSLFAIQVVGLNVNCGSPGHSSSDSDGKDGDPKGFPSLNSKNGSNGGNGGTCVRQAYIGGDETVVPAPPAVWLLGTALAGLAGRRLRQAARQAA